MSVTVTMQYLENYGYEEGANYWKFKWGNQYVVGGTDERPANAVAMIQEKHGYMNPASMQFVFGWEMSDTEPDTWFVIERDYREGGG